MAEKVSTQAKGVPTSTPDQILTPHTCLEDSAPDLEGEDITELEDTHIPKSPKKIKGIFSTLN
jgi:hypothetical protein